MSWLDQALTLRSTTRQELVIWKLWRRNRSPKAEMDMLQLESWVLTYSLACDLVTSKVRHKKPINRIVEATNVDALSRPTARIRGYVLSGLSKIYFDQFISNLNKIFTSIYSEKQNNNLKTQCGVLKRQKTQFGCDIKIYHKSYLRMRRREPSKQNES